VDNSPATRRDASPWVRGDVQVTQDQITREEIARIDMSARYALAADVPLVVRAQDELQIGVEEPRRVLLRNAPDRASRILAALDGAEPVGAVLVAHDADPVVWCGLLGELLAAGLLIAVGDPAGAPARPSRGPGHLSQERIALSHRHGQLAAGRILQTRQDAIVVIRGDSPAAALVATLVATAGVGHVHHDPTPSGLSSADATGGPRRSWPAGTLHAANPFVRTHRPAGHQSPAMVVLADDPMPDLVLAATLVQQRVPHLSVQTQAGRALVGPLVLPGRSSCLGCVHRHRADADPGWPAVARQLSRQSPRAPVTIWAIAACFAAAQVLELLDGASTPATVNGTVEWTPDGLSARRRTWPEHPDCGCRAC